MPNVSFEATFGPHTPLIAFTGGEGFFRYTRLRVRLRSRSESPRRLGHAGGEPTTPSRVAVESLHERSCEGRADRLAWSGCGQRFERAHQTHAASGCRRAFLCRSRRAFVTCAIT